jgi:hypothetical protein
VISNWIFSDWYVGAKKSGAAVSLMNKKSGIVVIGGGVECVRSEYTRYFSSITSEFN